MRRGTASAVLLGAANAALVAVVPLALGAALRWQGLALLSLLAAAAAAEGRLAHPEEGAPAPLVRASALALLATFWLALLGPGAGAGLAAAGLLLVGLGVALRLAALVALGAAFVSAHRAGPVTMDDIYRHIRHPSETGQLLLGLGAAASMGSLLAAVWWALLVLPLALVRLRAEEATLCASADYRAYRARVPALLPLTPRSRRLGCRASRTRSSRGPMRGRSEG